MKIEFVKEEKMGDAIYYCKVNGIFIDGSLRFDEDKARDIYNHLVKNNGVFAVTTILDSVEIN